MVSESFTIINKLGLHMRPASLFVQAMSKYDSDLTILFQGKSIDGKKEGDVRVECCPPYEIYPDTVHAETLSASTCTP